MTEVIRKRVYAILDEDGYLKSASLGDHFVDPSVSFEVDDPDKVIDFFFAYKVVNDELIYDEERFSYILNKVGKEQIRERRERDCFVIVNRSRFWYASLTLMQIEELRQWYLAWLDAPETSIIPETPTWLSLKL